MLQPFAICILNDNNKPSVNTYDDGASFSLAHWIIGSTLQIPLLKASTCYYLAHLVSHVDHLWYLMILTISLLIPATITKGRVLIGQTVQD